MKVNLHVYRRKLGGSYILDYFNGNFIKNISVEAFEGIEKLFDEVESAIIELRYKNYDYDIINDAPAEFGQRKNPNYEPIPEKAFAKLLQIYSQTGAEKIAV